MVSEHAELAFYFSSVMSVARMQHLPTFKDKAQQYPGHVTMALLNYPILMAADILLYKAERWCRLDLIKNLIWRWREVARKMNELYRMDFPEPRSCKLKLGISVPDRIWEDEQKCRGFIYQLDG